MIELYGQGSTSDLDEEDELIAGLDCTSPAFIRELLRRAALTAAEEDEAEGQLRVTDRHLRESLAELREAGGRLTQTLLGAQPLASHEEAAEDDHDDEVT